jgi:hypothetical protein
MCKLSNLYVLDLFSNTSTGAIEFNVANSLPKLLNAPCKLIVKQMQIELHHGASLDFTGYVNLRVVHNMITQSGTNNFNGSNTSNVLSFINNFSIRNNPDAQHQMSYSETDLKMFLPNGLPSVLLLNRRGSSNVDPLNDVSCDLPTLSWAVKLEITVNPDDE